MKAAELFNKANTALDSSSPLLKQATMMVLATALITPCLMLPAQHCFPQTPLRT